MPNRLPVRRKSRPNSFSSPVESPQPIHFDSPHRAPRSSQSRAKLPARIVPHFQQTPAPLRPFYESPPAAIGASHKSQPPNAFVRFLRKVDQPARPKPPPRAVSPNSSRYR